MLVRVFSVFLMILSLLVGFQQAVIVMHFKLNQDRIEQAYCVNKNKPELKCHGLCQLRKQLEDQENSEAASIKNYPRMDMMLSIVFQFEAKLTDHEIREIPDTFLQIKYLEPLREIVTPPPII